VHVFYTIRLESGPFCEIGGLVVSKNIQGKGIGKLLVEKARKWAAERNIGKLRVRCNVVRAGAHEFYIKSGFTENKQQKVFECNLNQL
jgi:GNAT superfamily N-acetyltransferase